MVREARRIVIVAGKRMVFIRYSRSIRNLCAAQYIDDVGDKIVASKRRHDVCAYLIPRDPIVFAGDARRDRDAPKGLPLVICIGHPDLVGNVRVVDEISIGDVEYASPHALHTGFRS